MYHQNTSGYYELSPLSCILSPSALPISLWERGGEKRAKKRWHPQIPFLQLLAAFRGQDAIGSALCVSWSCSLSNRKQEQQTAKLSGDRRVRVHQWGRRMAQRMFSAPACRGGCSAPLLPPPGMAATGAGALHPTESSLRAQHMAFLI